MNGNDSGIAEARDRLREKAQNEATCIALNDMLKDAQKEIVRLREENERLRGWIRVEGDRNDTCTRQILGEVCHGCKCGKTLPEPAP